MFCQKCGALDNGSISCGKCGSRDFGPDKPEILEQPVVVQSNVVNNAQPATGNTGSAVSGCIWLFFSAFAVIYFFIWLFS